MESIELKSGKKVIFHEGSKDTPVMKWNKFLSYMIQASDLGPNYESAAAKMGLLVSMVSEKRFEDFNTAINNLHTQIFYIFRGINPGVHAAAWRVKSVDGVYVETPSDELIKELENEPSLTMGILEDLTEEFRKK